MADAEAQLVFIGDVGQNTREEIDLIAARSGGGHNFGWRGKEGTLCTPGIAQSECGVGNPVEQTNQAGTAETGNRDHLDPPRPLVPGELRLGHDQGRDPVETVDSGRDLVAALDDPPG